MRLRGHLLLLVLAGLLPVALFAAGTSYLLVQEQRDTFRRGAEERTLALLTAVDAELRGSIDAIESLSSVASLAEGDLQLFRRTAARALETHPQWININLALPDHRRVLDMLAPEGALLPPVTDDGEISRLLQTREPVIANLALGPVSNRWNFAVRVPVILDGAVTHVLSAVVRPDAIAGLVAAQHLPEGWVGVVLDANDRIVARTVGPETSRGRLASQSLRDALARAPHGWFRGSTIEGGDVYTPYRRSQTTGWVFAMGIPASAVDTIAWQAYAVFGAGLLGALALAFVFARIVGRRIAEPIASLASVTESVRRGEQVPIPHPLGVTEIEQFAHALENCLDALRQANRHKDEFLAMVSHELRNPLAALSTAGHVLTVADPAGERAVQARDVVVRQTDHMVRLVEDLIDVSRVTMGKLTLERRTLDLGELVSRVAATWRSAGRFDGTDVALTVSPVWVEADRTRVEQVFSNLLDNALKFTPSGKRVAVAVHRNGDEAVLQVADEGEGIAPELMPMIFDAFVQGDGLVHRTRGGLGLGLALVKRLTELHGGSVEASSAGPGKGAVFTVRLPSVPAIGAGRS